ncbi:MAG: hypothetical protein GY861_09580 [bacterium]|nr:hypothetical protein [bacterium]
MSNYRVKVRKGISIFYDKELADQCAKENGTKVEVILDPNRDKQTDRSDKDV